MLNPFNYLLKSLQRQIIGSGIDDLTLDKAIALHNQKETHVDDSSLDPPQVPLTPIPTELLQFIFGFLNTKYVFNARLVCKKWKAIVDAQPLYKKILEDGRITYQATCLLKTIHENKEKIISSHFVRRPELFRFLSLTEEAAIANSTLDYQTKEKLINTTMVCCDEQSAFYIDQERIKKVHFHQQDLSEISYRLPCETSEIQRICLHNNQLFLIAKNPYFLWPPISSSFSWCFGNKTRAINP